MLCTTVYSCVHYLVAPQDAHFRALLAWGLGIAVIATIQVSVAALVDLHLELLLPLYPLAYWTINALAAIRSQTPGLVRGPRKRVVWDLARSST